MNPIPEQISMFIKESHVLSLSVIYNGNAWAANCFYVFVPEENGLIIITDTKTIHGQAFLQNNNVAGTISNNQKEIVKIKGVQLQGKVKKLEGDEYNEARKRFVKKFPFVRLFSVSLWQIELYKLKMTDNSIFFSHKFLWER